MASGRSAKRARKKDRRNSRREEWRRAMHRRRRQRLGVLLASLGIVAAGVLIAFFAFDRSPEEQPATTPEAEDSATTIAAIKRPVACGAKLPASAGSTKRTYPGAPNQKLDPDNTYIWRLATSCGDIEIELDVKRAPKTSNSVAFLTRRKFFDGLFFHRINEGFVIQGGDPSGDGSGGAGYDVVEPPPEGLKYASGIVAMAKAGTDPPGSSSSQFFIVTGGEGEVLPPEYALLGKVVKGMDVAKKIEKLGTAEDGPPKEWPYIERATIVER